MGRSPLLRTKQCATCGKTFGLQAEHKYTKSGKAYCCWSCYNGHAAPDIQDHPGFVTPKPLDKQKHSEVKSTIMILTGERAYNLIRQGMSADEVAKKYGLTARGVRNIAGRYRTKVQGEKLDAPPETHEPTVEAVIESLAVPELEGFSEFEQQEYIAEPTKLIFCKRNKTLAGKRPQIRLSQNTYEFINNIRRETGMTGVEIMDRLVEYVKPDIVIEKGSI